MAFSLTSILPLPDMLALGWFFLCWVGYAYYADQRRWGSRELASVLHDYRLRWMTRVLERENRIADTVVLQTVMRSDKLFITTTLLIIAGLISSLGAVDWVQAGCRPGAGHGLGHRLHRRVFARNRGAQDPGADRDFRVRLFQVHLVAAPVHSR